MNIPSIYEQYLHAQQEVQAELDGIKTVAHNSITGVAKYLQFPDSIIVLGADKEEVTFTIGKVSSEVGKLAKVESAMILCQLVDVVEPLAKTFVDILTTKKGSRYTFFTHKELPWLEDAVRLILTKKIMLQKHIQKKFISAEAARETEIYVTICGLVTDFCRMAEHSKRDESEEEKQKIQALQDSVFENIFNLLALKEKRIANTMRTPLLEAPHE